MARHLLEQGLAITVLLTGGAEFKGPDFVTDWLDQHDEWVINLDKLAYAGNLNNLSSLESDKRHVSDKKDMCGSQLLKNLLTRYQLSTVINFAS